MNKKERDNSPLLSIKIQISDNDIADLTILEEEVIEERVKEFCVEHNLPESAQGIITQQVMNQLDDQINECKIIKYKLTFFSTRNNKRK
jgi:RNA-binding protein YhbY